MSEISATITKHARETLVIGFKFHSPSLESGEEQIISAYVDAPPGISVNAKNLDITSPTVTIPVYGGTAGQDYVLRFTATTDNGQVHVHDYLVKVIA